MTKLIAGTLFTLALATGCKKKDDNAAPPPAANAPATEPAAAAKPTEATPPAAPAAPAEAATPAKAEYKPDEIFKEAAPLGVMDRNEKYASGVTVTGTVKSIKDDPTGEYVVVFDAGDSKTVEAMIMDPKPARDNKLKEGDSITLTKCSLANGTETSLPLRNCELKP